MSDIDDPAIHFCHRFAIVLECMILSPGWNHFWDEATALLDEYHAAQDKWRDALGEGLGKKE